MEISKTELRKKNIIYSLVLIVVVGIVYVYRNYVASENSPPHLEGLTEVYNSGITMGVIQYNIKYLSKNGADFQPKIDSVLAAFNQSLSTYIPDSEISRFNVAETSSLKFESPFFYPVLKTSKKVHDATNGAFDPTIMPLVNAWGFGPDKEPVLKYGDDTMIDSLRQYVDFNLIEFNEDSIVKLKPGVQVDFSAVAKGYAVDLVANFLANKDIENYMVEIGGELSCKGVNSKDKIWLIGVDNPLYLERGGDNLGGKVKLKDKALATSGNYKNYYIKDGKRYAHTISPITGLPIFHSLLSASVFAENCMLADAYATAFMVLGKDSAIQIIENNPEIEGFLIYDEDGKMKTFVSPSLKSYFVE